MPGVNKFEKHETGLRKKYRYLFFKAKCLLKKVVCNKK